MEARSVDDVDSRTGRKDEFGIFLSHGFPDFDLSCYPQCGFHSSYGTILEQAQIRIHSW